MDSSGINASNASQKFDFNAPNIRDINPMACLLYTSDAADE